MTREFPRREFLRGVAGAVAAIAVGSCAPATMPAAQGKTVLAATFEPALDAPAPLRPQWGSSGSSATGIGFF
jgi:hypothetical protein